MGAFVKGDVVVVLFPFSDLSSAKKRPAVVVADLPGNDVVLCMVTGQAVRDSNAIALEDTDFDSGSLQKPSNIRPNRLFTADGTLVDYRVGVLSPSKINDVTEAIIAILRN